MFRNLSKAILMLILASLVLAACAPAATTVPTAQVVKETQLVEVTKIVAGTPVTTVITATPVPQPTKMPAGSVQVNGSGATFPVPVYTEWTFAYQYVDPSVTINYQGVGSGGGKKAIIDGTVDFAGSDSLVTDDEYKTGVDLQMYPVLGGPVAVIYNIAGLAATDVIVLDRATLVGIYNGTIKNWNDEAIKKTNAAIADKLPAKVITVVHRSDGSGTTEIFTKALSAFSSDWKAGAASAIEWPADKAGNGVGGKGNQGVAATVQNTPNSIGYVELSYAVQNAIPFISMINKAGKTVKPSGASAQAAMADFADKLSAKLTVDIVDGAGDATYPISGYTYLILHSTNMKDCVKAKKILEFFKWSLTDATAAKRATDLGYAPLPAAMQKIVLDKFATVTCSGQPVLK
jgi:phosphate transport system substrate-binding protein